MPKYTFATALAANISPDYVPVQGNKTDQRIATRLIQLWETPAAIQYFAKNHKELTSYNYWYLLGTLWVSYTGWSDLAVWKQLFSSTRKNRETSLMKPDELRAYRALPEVVTVYRAHRPNETDWISYTIDTTVAAQMAWRRGVSEVRQYAVDKADLLCLFLRRGEKEVLVLDKTTVRYIETIPVIVEDSPEHHSLLAETEAACA